MRIRVNIVQANPYPQFSQHFAQFLQTGFEWTTIPESGAVFGIDTVGTGVLRNY